MNTITFLSLLPFITTILYTYGKTLCTLLPMYSNMGRCPPVHPDGHTYFFVSFVFMSSIEESGTYRSKNEQRTEHKQKRQQRRDDMIQQYVVREISREVDAGEIWVKFECLTHNTKSDEISRTVENCPEECLPPLVRSELLGKVQVSRDLCRSWTGGRFV